MILSPTEKPWILENYRMLTLGKFQEASPVVGAMWGYVCSHNTTGNELFYRTLTTFEEAGAQRTQIRKCNKAKMSDIGLIELRRAINLRASSLGIVLQELAGTDGDE